ncbi:MAG: hypothetical protein LBH84_07350 [Prevotellaceae bacterium]|jgi:hypothetical protein|nr:hypothetical protein [Prevotellaceae bacterium]
MKIQQKVIALTGTVLALCSLTSCPYERYPEDYYEPVYMTRAELESSVRFSQIRPLYSAGKIYVRGSQLFICEPYKGVHVIDNSNPRQPQPTGFVAIPGCVDIAVHGNILYADNATDLVAVDLDQHMEVARERNAFRSIASPNGTWWWVNSEKDNGKIIVDFIKKEKRQDER